MMRESFVIAVGLACSVAHCSLVGHWEADGNAIDVANGNNGVIVGTVGYSAGKIGQAFQFSGTGHVEVSSAPEFAFGTGDFSVAF